MPIRLSPGPLPRKYIRVPDQLSLVGFDNIRFAEHVDPALTTIAQPMQQIGEGTVRLLRILAGGGDAEMPESVTLPHKLVVRESTAPPPSRRRRNTD
jgi:LacI family transcriptional regulator, repressor for deo operon, udp, cdd, tsx, nupC, and nupG